jgi:hypothetical protein
VVPLKDGFLLTTGASMPLGFLSKGGSGKDTIWIAMSFLNGREFDLGVNEMAAAFGALQHPVRHGLSA